MVDYLSTDRRIFVTFLENDLHFLVSLFCTSYLVVVDIKIWDVKTIVLKSKTEI